MSTPCTIQEFLALVRQSGLIDSTTVANHMRRHAQAVCPREVADSMVAANLVTPFQAEQLLRGRWRRFTIGPYKILDQIGTGGMGSVYLCEHKHLGRKVAVKVLPAASIKNPGALERFYREARAGGVLNHPNIVRAFDVGQDQTLHYLAMEYVDGASLQDIVSGNSPLAPLQAVHYMRQAAWGLQHIFESGLIHRDMKPGNLVVDMTGTVKVLDLGLARFFGDETDD